MRVDVSAAVRLVLIAIAALAAACFRPPAPVRAREAIPPGLRDVQAIAAGARHCLAVKTDGTVVGWGENGEDQITIPASLRDVTAVVAAGYYSLALRRDGTVVAWGHTDRVPPLRDIVALAPRLALKADGTVVRWGDDTNLRAEPRSIIAIAAGGGH